MVNGIELYARSYYFAQDKFFKNKLRETVDYCKSDLESARTPPYWQIKTCLLIVCAAPIWYEAELYRLLALEIYTHTKAAHDLFDYEPDTERLKNDDYLNELRRLLDVSLRDQIAKKPTHMSEEDILAGRGPDYRRGTDDVDICLLEHLEERDAIWDGESYFDMDPVVRALQDLADWECGEARERFAKEEVVVEDDGDGDAGT